MRSYWITKILFNKMEKKTSFHQFNPFQWIQETENGGVDFSL